MAGFLDWLTGRDKERAREAAALEQSRKDAAELQADALARGATEWAAKHQEPIKRREGEPRPAERLMPEEAGRMIEAANRPPEAERPAEPRSEKARVATRMENTMTPQLAPSLGGPGTVFVNPRAQPPRRSIWEDDIQAARKEEEKPRSREDRIRDLDRELGRER